MELLINNWKILESENKALYAGKEVILQPLCMSLLIFLSQRAGVVVNRKEIIDSVWKGRVVSEDALNNSIKKIRKALGDDPKKPQLIETINKKGYRLIANVEHQTKSTKKKEHWLMFGFTAVCLIFVCLWSFIDIEILTIEPEMTEFEKQQQYNKIQALTSDGGHIIKLETT